MKLNVKIFVISWFAVFCMSNYSYGVEYPRDTTYTVYSTYIKLKKHYPEIKIVYPEADKSVKSEENVTYKTVQEGNEPRPIFLDIFRPAQKGKYPAIVMIHGGGWSSGDKSMEKPMAQQIAKKGYVAVAVEYRMSPEAKYPAAIYDIKAAIKWLKKNAERYDVDTTRMAIEGESAGGQLAALVGMTNGIQAFEDRQDDNGCSATVQAVIDVDGVVDFLSPASLNLVRKPNSADVRWFGGTFLEKPETWKQASPIFYVNKNSVPVLFITSSMPRFHAGRDEMIDLMTQNGVHTEKRNLPGSPHSFWLFEPWFQPTLQSILGFLDEKLK